MSLRGEPIEESATLPDGREVRLRIGVVEDSYVARSELDTVDIVLSDDEEHLAAVATTLDVEQSSEARLLARVIVHGLESGELEPTAGAIEALADRLRG